MSKDDRPNPITLNQKLEIYIAMLGREMSLILPERKEMLINLAAIISELVKKDLSAKLIFICTHNSRRSHLAQLWAQVAAHKLGIEKVLCYSGGTEATEFNIHAVEALIRAGFIIKIAPGEVNPIHKVYFSKNEKPVEAFSKVYDHTNNPQDNFIAVMTCNEAEEACPLVSGSDEIVSLNYEDPKKSDGSGKEMEVYDKRCMQIASEMFYLMSKVSG